MDGLESVEYDCNLFMLYTNIFETFPLRNNVQFDRRTRLRSASSFRYEQPRTVAETWRNVRLSLSRRLGTDFRLLCNNSLTLNVLNVASKCSFFSDVLAIVSHFS